MTQTARIVTSGTGIPETSGSDAYFRLAKGSHWIGVRWAGSAGDLKLIERPLGGADTDWADVIDNAGNGVQITTATSWLVPGNREYSVSVTTHTSAATVTTEQASD